MTGFPGESDGQRAAALRRGAGRQSAAQTAARAGRHVEHERQGQSSEGGGGGGVCLVGGGGPTFPPLLNPSALYVACTICTLNAVCRRRHVHYVVVRIGNVILRYIGHMLMGCFVKSCWAAAAVSPGAAGVAG